MHNSMNTQMTDLGEANAEEAPGARAAPTDELDLSGQTNMASFRTHRSFQRVIHNVIERQPPSTTVVFLLRHPHAKHRNVMICRVPFSVRTLRPSHCVLGG
jgi:hypothetical protein